MLLCLSCFPIEFIVRFIGKMQNCDKFCFCVFELQARARFVCRSCKLLKKNELTTMTFLNYLKLALELYLKLFFILTPFFVLSAYLALTEGQEESVLKKLVFRIFLGTACVMLTIFFAGPLIMSAFGITVDSFRAGSGILLLLTSISLVSSKPQETQGVTDPKKLLDMAVVPIAVPITAGPATLGTLMVMGTSGVTAESLTMKLLTGVVIILAVATIAVMLRMARKIDQLMGHTNVSILSKITGLILSAIAVQMIVLGVKNLWLN